MRVLYSVLLLACCFGATAQTAGQAFSCPAGWTQACVWLARNFSISVPGNSTGFYVNSTSAPPTPTWVARTNLVSYLSGTEPPGSRANASLTPINSLTANLSVSVVLPPCTSPPNTTLCIPPSAFFYSNFSLLLNGNSSLVSIPAPAAAQAFWMPVTSLQPFLQGFMFRFGYSLTGMSSRAVNATAVNITFSVGPSMPLTPVQGFSCPTGLGWQQIPGVQACFLPGYNFSAVYPGNSSGYFVSTTDLPPTPIWLKLSDAQAYISSLEPPNATVVVSLTPLNASYVNLSVTVKMPPCTSIPGTSLCIPVGISFSYVFTGNSTLVVADPGVNVPTPALQSSLAGFLATYGYNCTGTTAVPVNSTAITVTFFVSQVIGQTTPTPTPSPYLNQVCFASVCFLIGQNVSVVAPGNATAFGAPGYSPSFVTVETLYMNIQGSEYNTGFVVANISYTPFNSSHVTVNVTVTPVPGWYNQGCASTSWVGPFPPTYTYIPASIAGCFPLGVSVTRDFTGNATGIFLPPIWAPTSLRPTLGGGLLMQPQFMTPDSIKASLASTESSHGGILSNVTLTPRSGSLVTLKLDVVPFNATGILPPSVGCSHTAVVRGNSSGIFVTVTNTQTPVWVSAPAVAAVAALLGAGPPVPPTAALIPITGDSTNVIVCEFYTCGYQGCSMPPPPPASAIAG